MVSKKAVSQIHSEFRRQVIAAITLSFEKPKQEPEEAIATQREKFISRLYEEGGKFFVEMVQQYGTNERGEPLKLTPWYLEYLEAIGTLSLPEFYASGCSQVGKTLGHTLLLCFVLIEGRLNPIWAYDAERSQNIQVPSNVRPVIRAWLKQKGITLRRSEGTQNNTLLQIPGAEVQFMYTSTSKMSDTGGAAAGGIAVGTSRDLYFIEERSQHAPGSTEPPKRRLDAGRLPSKPIREIGTPGAGLGIEQQIEKADYHFYPHCKCEGCGKVVALHPKGCLLKPMLVRSPSGEIRHAYLSESGRPMSKANPNGQVENFWHHKDSGDAIASAYFGCSSCGAELPSEAREQAWFADLKTGKRLREFLDELPPGILERRISIGITLSPLLRIEKVNTAAAIIREGIDTQNTSDWQQQRLGIKSESSVNSIPLDNVLKAIAAPTPTRKPDLVLAGADQGRSEDWLWVAEFYKPENHKSLSVEQIIEQTTRVLKFGGDIMRGAIADRLSEYDVDFGLIDNEPDRTNASELCRATVLEMADQRPGLVDAVKLGRVSDGGSIYECWNLRNEKFLKQVLGAFLAIAPDGYPMYRLPAEWDKWIGNSGERSPLVHLTAPSYDPSTGKWKRGANNLDDLYYAAMFCEAAYYLKLTEGVDASWVGMV